mmetsp:Transcript_42414/g.95736  ORF Transcript_42414/g.95736 Transcript_42414/m.95736 type:complete len:456 (+) Transcript_42414:162-1529(+)
MASIPYIGSKISLITTSDIRYEGILYTLNREESTIAVQNVRSFGTEGRRCPEVPMSNEIYDFIIFRGKDLKDLTVLQGAPERQPANPSQVGSELPDSNGHNYYNQAAVAPQPQSELRELHRADPAYSGMGAVARNGYPANMGGPSTASEYSPWDYTPPTSSASRPAESQAFGAGFHARAPFSASEVHGASLGATDGISRAPLYEEANGVAASRGAEDAGAAAARAPGGVFVSDDRGAAAMDPKGDKARGRGKGGGQKKQLHEVLRFHKRAEETIMKTMKNHSSAHIQPTELRAMSERDPSVYHFYLDFINYCNLSHTVQSDEQQWDSLCKALKKHFEKDFGANQNQKPPQPQRPNNTLGDFITIETNSKTAKKNAKVPVAAAAPRAGRGSGRGRGDKKDLDGPNDLDGPGGTEDSGAGWACPRCTLRNEDFLTECAACGTSKQQAALWAEFPPLG